MEKFEIIKEELDKQEYPEGIYYVYEQTFVDENSSYRREIEDVDGSKTVVGIKNTKFYILDSNFNRLVVTVGEKLKESPEKIAQFKQSEQEIFIGKSAPFDIICGKKFNALNRERFIGVWEVPTTEQIEHYKKLLELKDIENSRLVPISNEDKNYFIYFTPETHADENNRGHLIEAETFYYLDEEFNKFVMNVSKVNSKHFASVIAKQAAAKGREIFVGAHSPEIVDVHGDYVPNTNPKTVGIWEKASKEELERYKTILARQNERKASVRLVC